MRNRSSYNIILWPTGDITHFPGERISQLNQIWIISNKMLIVLCLRQCFVSHLRSFINFFPRLSSFIVFLFKRSSMFRILNLNTPHGCLLERILNLRCFELQTTGTTGWLLTLELLNTPPYWQRSFLLRSICVNYVWILIKQCKKHPWSNKSSRWRILTNETAEVCVPSNPSSTYLLQWMIIVQCSSALAEQHYSIIIHLLSALCISCQLCTDLFIK